MKNLRIPLENKETNESHRIPCEKNENHANLRNHVRIKSNMKILRFYKE